MEDIKKPSDILWSGAAEFQVTDNEDRGASGVTVPVEGNAGVTPEDGQIAWGSVSNGLQAGLRAPRGKRSLEQGQTLRYDYLVRNVGTSLVTFQYGAFPGVAGGVPDITAADGKSVMAGGEPILNTAEVRQVALKSGESIVIGHTNCGLVKFRHTPGQTTMIKDANPRHDANKAYTYMESRPGGFKMRQVETLFVPSLDKRDLSLCTGWMDFEVVAQAAIHGAPQHF